MIQLTHKSKYTISRRQPDGVFEVFVLKDKELVHVFEHADIMECINYIEEHV